MITDIFAFGLGLILLSSCCANAKPSASEYFLTPLDINLAEAAAHGQSEKVVELLTSGVDVNKRGKGGMTFLMWALLNRNKSGFECLLEHGANPNNQITEPFVHILTAGDSPLSLAAMLEDPWFFEVVLKHHGDPNLVNPVRSVPPIFESIARFRDKQIEMLMEAGADLNYRDKNGDTPMIIAATINRYDIVYKLIKAGADPELKNRFGKSIVYVINHIAIDSSQPMYQWKMKVIVLLKEKGMDTEHGD